MREFGSETIVHVQHDAAHGFACLSAPRLVGFQTPDHETATVVIHMGRQLAVLGREPALGDGGFAGPENLHGDGAGRLGDGNLVDLHAADFWVGAGHDVEGVFGAVGVVFFVGDLVGAEAGG